MNVKWPEKKPEHYNAKDLWIENKGWNRAIDACIKAYNEAPALVPLNEEKLRSVLCEFDEVILNCAKDCENHNCSSGLWTLLGTISKSICTRFGVKVPTVGELAKVHCDAELSHRHYRGALSHSEYIATAIHAYLGGKE